MKNLIAILEDETDILNLVSINLQRSGFETAEFEAAEGLFEFIKTKKPNLLVLDLMLPDMDGLEVCKTLKKEPEYSDIPIIMLTAKTDITDRVLGLEFGADDYVTKPFSPKELVARVKAVLRRTKESEQEQSKTAVFGGILKIDYQKYQVFVENKLVELTLTEFKILKQLSKRPGWIYSRNQILDVLWGNDKIVLDRTVDVHIRNLRVKLGKAADFIKNMRSVGYKFQI
jgi:DNA-binding response OmpR family regulator